jgi:hypothetical protein
LGIYFFAFFLEICLQAALNTGSNRGQKKELLHWGSHGKSAGHPQEESQHILWWLLRILLLR